MTYQINELKLIRARSKLFCADARNFGLTNMMARSALKIRNRARAQNINTPSQNEVRKQGCDTRCKQFTITIARFGHPRNLTINIYFAIESFLG